MDASSDAFHDQRGVEDEDEDEEASVFCDMSVDQPVYKGKPQSKVLQDGLNGYCLLYVRLEIDFAQSRFEVRCVWSWP